MMRSWIVLILCAGFFSGFFPVFFSVFFSAGFFNTAHASSGNLEEAFMNLAQKVMPGVVNISSSKNVSSVMPPSFQQMPFFFFQPHHFPKSISASGSGFVVDKKGWIITNHHVVQGFDEIQVQFDEDENSYKVKLLGSDAYSDIALLQVSTDKELYPLEFGDSENLKVGQWVAAIGNPHGYGHSMSQGIISSAIQRDLDELNLFPLLQTDAGINPGNSGGPLVNLKGQVVGVNQAVHRGADNIGFAIPINNVKEVFKDLKTYGKFRKAYIGILFEQNRQGKKGVEIVKVFPNSPAEKAGLKPGDWILSLAGQPIKKQRDLPKAVRKAGVGKQVSLKILRDGSEVHLRITPQDDELSAQQVRAEKTKSAKGVLVAGGFKIAPLSEQTLDRFQIPDFRLKNPIVTHIQPKSPAFRGGLKPGDLIYQLNGLQTRTVASVKKSIQKGLNNLYVLRYHRRYDKYNLIRIRFQL